MMELLAAFGNQKYYKCNNIEDDYDVDVDDDNYESESTTGSFVCV